MNENLKIIEAMSDDIEYEDWIEESDEYTSYSFGLRQLRSKDLNNNVGDILPESYDLSIENWENTPESDLKTLGGTSAIEINQKSFKIDSEKEITRVLALVREYVKNEKENIVLVRGDNFGSIENSDEGEVIIKDAEIILTLN